MKNFRRTVFKCWLMLIIGMSLQSAACSKENQSEPDDDKNPDMELGFQTEFATFGDYKKTDDKVYVDKYLKQVEKSKATYYLKRDLLGRDLVPNDDETGNYWEDRKYFKGTPILKFFYEYYRIDNNELFFAVNASELEGTTSYMFHGKALWASNNKPLAQGGYSVGELDGDFKVLNPNGTTKDEFGFDRGRYYTNKQKIEDVYKPLVGKWEAIVEDDGGFKRTTQVYEMMDNGILIFYSNIYLNESPNTPVWKVTDHGQNTKTMGSWKYSDDKGKMELFFKGNLLLEGTMTLKLPSQFTIKPTMVADAFKNENSMKELQFIKK